MIGAGGGNELSTRGPSNPKWIFTGVNPSKEMLQMAKNKSIQLGMESRVKLIQGTIADLPHPSCWIYIDDDRNFPASTGHVGGDFFREDRVGLKTSKSYPIRGTREIRGSRKFGQRGGRGAISPGGWKNPEF